MPSPVSPVSTRSPADAAAPPSPRPRVLIVEDNPGDIHLIKEAFQEARLEAEILVAENAVQAFTYMRDLPEAEAPNLVLIDLNLPIIKGPTVLREVREHRPWKRSRAVVLSSSSAEQEISTCLKLGADEYVVKPTAFEDYVALAQYLRRHFDATSPAARPQRLIVRRPDLAKTPLPAEPTPPVPPAAPHAGGEPKPPRSSGS